MPSHCSIALYGKRDNLEIQIMSLESASTNAEVILAMKQGKEAIDASLREA